MDTENVLFNSHATCQLAVAIGYFQSDRSPNALQHAIGALRASLVENPFTVAGSKGEIKSADLLNRTLEWLVRSGLDAAKSDGDDAVVAKAISALMDKNEFWWNSNDYSVENSKTWTW